MTITAVMILLSYDRGPYLPYPEHVANRLTALLERSLWLPLVSFH